MTQTEALRALIAKLDTTRPCMGSPSECGVPNFGEELEAARAALAQPSPTAETVDREAVAWLHTLHMEGGQTCTRLTEDDDNAFGEPGRDYSAEYTVTSEPLYRSPGMEEGSRG